MVSVGILFVARTIMFDAITSKIQWNFFIKQLANSKGIFVKMKIIVETSAEKLLKYLIEDFSWIKLVNLQIPIERFKLFLYIV